MCTQIFIVAILNIRMSFLRQLKHTLNIPVWCAFVSRCLAALPTVEVLPFCTVFSLYFSSLLYLSLSLKLRPTVNWPVCLGIKHPSGANDQIFIIVRPLRVCWCGALSLTRGQVCHLQLLLVLACAVIFGSESRGTRDHILLSQNQDFPFRRLLRLAGLRRRYSTPPPHRTDLFYPQLVHAMQRRRWP
jgi:hypothetical protein